MTADPMATDPMSAERSLRRGAYGLIAGFLLHNADHARRGLGGIGEGVVWAGTLLLAVAAVAVTLILTRHYLAVAAATIVGWTVAVGVSSAHLLPDWGPLSDSLTQGDVDVLTWLAVGSEILAGAWLGLVGLRALRADGYRITPTAAPAAIEIGTS